MNWPKKTFAAKWTNSDENSGPPQVATLDLLMLSLIIFSGLIGFSSYYLLCITIKSLLHHSLPCLLPETFPPKKNFTSPGSVHELPPGGVFAETSKLSTGRMNCSQKKNQESADMLFMASQPTPQNNGFISPGKRMVDKGLARPYFLQRYVKGVGWLVSHKVELPPGGGFEL